MTQLKKILLLSAFILLIMPLSASAFWFWDKPAAKVETKIVTPAAELSEAEKLSADAKYKIWNASFEKKDMNAVIANNNNFWFTTAELNYLFNSESGKAKTPLLSNFKLTNENNVLNVSADFKRILKGRFSFNFQLTDENNKIKLNISKTKIYGVPIPSSWVSGTIDRELDQYFSFLYKDSRYQGISLSSENNVLKLNLEIN
ncbi:MAG: hypothetical protein ACOYL8_00255 [Patescibacteria group bacterium]